MDLTSEQENFIKLARLIIEVIPKHLRMFFETKWDAKFPTKPWADDANSGQDLFNAIPASSKNKNGDLRSPVLQQNILAGKSDSWDSTVFFFLFLYSDLKLIDKCRPKSKRIHPLNDGERVDRLCEIRNEFYGQPSSTSVPSVHFGNVSSEIKYIASDLFGTVAENEIDQIINAKMTKIDYCVLTKDYDKEKRIHNEWILKVERRMQAMEDKFETFEEQRGQKPITQKAIDETKKTYQAHHKTHEIHTVDENSRIVLKEVDVSEFAVKLKISRCSAPKSDFKDEAKRYLDNLEDAAGDDIDISNLIDDKHRVTFICGIAGIGKSVLAKQLTYGWVNGDMYQNFMMCVMFECRDLNYYFKDCKGAEVKKHEVLGEFIKSKVNCDLGDGEGILIIVDGVDELFDITEEDSVIGQLLGRKIYPRSKVILTGRPHIEFKLNSYCNVGDLKTVEIQGLTNEQINKYVEKFSEREHHILDIKKAKGASNVPIIHVPQFLNTFCCIASLTKGKPISNSTELYSWTLYLLLKQHAGKYVASTKRASDIFKDFAQTLSKLSEVCHNLLTKNKIIFEGKIESRLGDIGKDKEFVESLFVNVSDNITEKYQFKHLSLMEFLSALYICKKDMKNLLEIIKDNLEKGFIEVVSFVCRLLSGFSYEGIIKEMLKNVVGLKQEVNEKQLLHDVIELLNECGLDWKTKLRRSFEIITFFLNKNFNEKEFIKSIIRKCHGDQFDSDEVATHNLCLICRHLESCGWKEDDIRMAFANVEFKWINVNEIEHLDIVTVKERFRIGLGICLRGTTTTVNAIREKFKEGERNEYCGKVDIDECVFMDDELNGRCSIDRQLEELRIWQCQMKTKESFLNACDWGMSCEVFWLRGLDIKIEWWERMVEMMEERRRKGDLMMKVLDIYKCTTRMNYEMERRIVHCGVKLRIDGKNVKKPPSPSTSPSTVDLLPLTVTESPSSSEEPDHRHRSLPSSKMSTSLRMTSPKTAVDNTADHPTPLHSPSSGTPSHEVRTPSQYPAPPTSSSSPSAERPTFQVPTDLTHTSTRPSSTADLQQRSSRSTLGSSRSTLRSSRSSLRSRLGDRWNRVRRTLRQCIVM